MQFRVRYGTVVLDTEAHILKVDELCHYGDGGGSGQAISTDAAGCDFKYLPRGPDG